MTDDMSPTNKGRNPTDFIFLKSVPSPTLAITMRIKNFATPSVTLVIDDGREKIVFTATAPAKNKIKVGKTLLIFTL